MNECNTHSYTYIFRKTENTKIICMANYKAQEHNLFNHPNADSTLGSTSNLDVALQTMTNAHHQSHKNHIIRTTILYDSNDVFGGSLK